MEGIIRKTLWSLLIVLSLAAGGLLIFLAMRNGRLQKQINEGAWREASLDAALAQEKEKTAAQEERIAALEEEISLLTGGETQGEAAAGEAAQKRTQSVNPADASGREQNQVEATALQASPQGANTSEDQVGSTDGTPGQAQAPAGTDPQAAAPGTVLAGAPAEEEFPEWFTSVPIVEGDAVFERINGRSWHENEDISLSQLVYLKLLHYNFDHKVQVGEMIVNAELADKVLDIFKDLYRHEYEVQSVYLIDNYWTGDPIDSDTNSIQNNNTSCFNYRQSTTGERLSKHALGKAIDINPQQNPYLELGEDGNYYGEHENALPYYDRTSGDPHVIVEGDVCFLAFTSRGFTWGGYWTNPIDYQHFEVN